MEELSYNPGDRIRVIKGEFTGRIGIYKKHCSKVFADWCHITLDLTKRERVQKTKFIEKASIEHESKSN